MSLVGVLEDEMTRQLETCGCVAVEDLKYGVRGINFCPMHKAAPGMLAALDIVGNQLRVMRYQISGPAMGTTLVEYVDTAIAAARDQEVGA